jgi:hydroxypyruvate isomerase
MDPLRLRYTSHLGYVDVDDPLYRQSVGSSDPRDHVAFAARQGLAGVLFPWAVSRPPALVESYRKALIEFRLQASAIVYAPLEDVLTPSWTRPTGWSDIRSHLDRSVPLANSLGSRMLAVLIRATPETSRGDQERALIDNLSRAGDAAAAAGLIIGVEHMIALPGMLLTNTAQAVELFDRLNHPAVKLIFDTGHVYDMDGDVLGAYHQAKHHIGLLQLADMPGRVEPGAGLVDIVSLLSSARRDGLADGLIDLEHGWSERTVEAEQRSLEMLRRIDRAQQTDENSL